MNAFHYAVVVGIDCYPGIGSLHLARGDAHEFFNWLIDPNGGDLAESNVRFIQTDLSFNSPQDAKPTRDTIESAFQQLHTAARQAFREDLSRWSISRLYIYFAGHGLSPSQSEVAFLAADASRDSLGKNIPCQKFVDYYVASQDYREIALFSDCCRNDYPTIPANGPYFTPQTTNRGKVVTAVCFATEFRESAYEPVNPTDADRGYYTKALLEGLAGSGADPITGIVDSSSLHRYATQRVLELTRDRPNPQRPRMLGDPALSILFRANAQRPLRTVTILPPAGFAGSITVSTFDRSVLLPAAGAAAGSYGLPDGWYKAELQSPGVPPQSQLFEVMGGDKNVQF